MGKGMQLEPTVPDAQSFFAAMELRIEKSVTARILKEISFVFTRLAAPVRSSVYPKAELREKFKGSKKKTRSKRGVDGWPGSVAAAIKLWKKANNDCQSCYGKSKSKRLLLEGAKNWATKVSLLKQAMQLLAESDEKAVRNQFPAICKSCHNRKYHIGGSHKKLKVA